MQVDEPGPVKKRAQSGTNIRIATGLPDGLTREEIGPPGFLVLAGMQCSARIEVSYGDASARSKNAPDLGKCTIDLDQMTQQRMRKHKVEALVFKGKPTDVGDLK